MRMENSVLLLVLVAIALVGGFALGLFVGWWRLRDVRALHAQAEAMRTQEIATLRESMKDAFATLSLEALSKSTDEFLKVAHTRLNQQTEANAHQLEGKKAQIDQTLTTMKAELEKVNTLVQTFEKDRQSKFEVLSQQLAHNAQKTQELHQTTGALTAALTNSRVRGQWGDRMAEDVLRIAGLKEGINYIKQATLHDSEGTTHRPDYTFKLPNGRTVHMDVKFPLEHYLNMLQAEDATSRETAKKHFLKDARARVNEAAKRNYSGASAGKTAAQSGDTLDYVLVFSPNDQVYGFVNEHDPALMDDALKQKVILCGPMTLYAILSVIHQAVENFEMERKAGEIMSVLSAFKVQWEKFTEAIDIVGKRLESTQKAYEDMAGPRLRQLEKPLSKLENLPQHGGSMALPAADENQPASPLQQLGNGQAAGLFKS